MRFEIRSGGIIAILVGVAALSGAVFVLGLLAGYDVGRESQLNSAQMAETYPVTPAPVAAASPGQAASPATPAAPRIQPVSRQAGAAVPVPAPAVPARADAAVAPAPRQRTASAQPPAAAYGAGSSDHGGAIGGTDDHDNPGVQARPTPPPRRTASVPAAPPPARQINRRPYNIQIEAAMDINGADAMMQRLQRLGYTPHLTTTDIDGHTWFKVEVGPYATQREAEDAQAQLREKYDEIYAPHGQRRAADGGSNNSNANSE
ncbi:MAG: SPOR domain-containing protein [Candidatus Binataceae bacterium]